MLDIASSVLYLSQRKRTDFQISATACDAYQPQW